MISKEATTALAMVRGGDDNLSNGRNHEAKASVMLGGGGAEFISNNEGD